MCTLNLAGAVRRRKNMRASDMRIECGSYKGETSTLGGKAIIDFCSKDKGTYKPDLLAINEIAVDPESDLLGDITAQPTAVAGENTIAVRWSKKGTVAMIDLENLFMIRQFNIPANHRAHVAITPDSVAGVGEALVFRFSTVQFHPIEVKGKKKQQAAKPGGRAHARPPFHPARLPAVLHPCYRVRSLRKGVPACNVVFYRSRSF